MRDARLTVVVAPHPPLLFRELGGLTDPVAELRAACHDALRGPLAAQPPAVRVVGPVPRSGGATTAGHPGGPVLPSVRRFGTAGPAEPAGLPLSLGVGSRLLADAGWAGTPGLVGLDVEAADDVLATLAGNLADDLAGDRPGGGLVLLMAEGSARRDEKGPGLLDPRAFDFDDGVLRALADGDAAVLAGLDADLARDLMVEGRACFRLLGQVGRLLGPPRAAAVSYADSPYGVMYPVATWRW